MEPTLTLLVGIPGSGKTTWANKRCRKNQVVLSSDLIRKELFNDETNQSNNKLVFKTLYDKAKTYLKNGTSVIIDATNATKADRKSALDHFSDLKIPVTAIVFTTPTEVCKIRDSKRQRTVGEDVINKFVQIYEKPTLSEGFNKISYVKYTQKNT